MNLVSKPTVVITGVSGQDGSLLARLLLSKGYRVVGLSRSSVDTRHKRFSYLGLSDVIQVQVNPCSERDLFEVLTHYAPASVFAFSGQGSVGKSFAEPVKTYESISASTIALCEALRKTNPEVKVFFASSSEIFSADVGPIDIDTPVQARSPYGMARCAANETVRYYQKHHLANAKIGHMFNHESELRGSDYVTRKLCVGSFRALTKPIKLQVGSLDVVRDWSCAREFMELIWDFTNSGSVSEGVFCSGQGQSLRKFVDLIFKYHSLDYRDYVEFDAALLRPTEAASVIGATTNLGGGAVATKSHNFEVFVETLMRRVGESLHYRW